MSKDNGGPAFPQSYSGDMMPHEGIAGGLSIRDYFAAHALAGLLSSLASADNVDAALALCGERHDDNAGQTLVRISYDMADAMLAEREKNDAK